jgi:hypothetical protein
MTMAKTKEDAKKTAAAAAAAPAAGTAVTEYDPKALAVFHESGETGFEQTTGDDYAVPFLKILQKMSPEVDRDNPAFIEGAEPGQFLNTATAKLYRGATIVPCYYRHAMVEWKPREDGGGFVAQHDPGVEVGMTRDESGRWETGRGTYLADTRYFFCLHVTEEGEPEPVVLPFASTQIKKARTWMTRMQALRMPGPEGTRVPMPMFANLWRITDVPEQNDKGTWRGYKVELVGPVRDAALAQAAVDARKSFSSVATKIKPPTEDAAAAGEAGTEAGAGKRDVPF